MLDGKVEMDETYVGGKRRGFGKRLGMANKETVIGIRKRNGELRFFHAKDAKSGTLAQYIRENISEDVDVIFTDEGVAYPDAMRRAGVKTHKTIQHKNRIYVQGDIHTNTIESAFSLLKRGIMGTWHKISVKHLPAYLEEMTFRFNRRNNSDLFVDTLREKSSTVRVDFGGGVREISRNRIRDANLALRLRRHGQKCADRRTRQTRWRDSHPREILRLRVPALRAEPKARDAPLRMTSWC